MKILLLLLFATIAFLSTLTFSSDLLRPSKAPENTENYHSTPRMLFFVDPTFPPPGNPGDAPFIVYGYRPSLALAIVGAASFGAAAILHLIQLCYFRTWFMILFPLGCGLEIAGYVFRAISTIYDPYKILWFVLQYAFIVVAPVFFSAGIYIIFTQMLKVSKTRVCLPRWAILLIFTFFDIACTAVQSTGAALIAVKAVDNEDFSTGETILIVGLAVQVGSFGLFLILWMSFLAKFSPSKTNSKHSWRACLIITTLAAIAIETRTIYRLVESIQGLYGYLNTHEIYFAFLEYLPVILAVMMFNLVHPGYVLSKKKQKEARKGVQTGRQIQDEAQTALEVKV